jgi:hypothetical protein
VLGFGIEVLLGWNNPPAWIAFRAKSSLFTDSQRVKRDHPFNPDASARQIIRVRRFPHNKPVCPAALKSKRKQK